MKKKISALFSIALFSLGSATANAAIINLFDWGVNIDGTASEIGVVGDPIPGNVDVSSFDLSTGLGQIDITISGIGMHNALTFLDLEIDEAINTFFNEGGSTGGSLGTGQSWEVDEPGYLFGDIYDNFLDNTLDNSNALPAGLEDDASMALGWDFSLAAGETAVASFFTSTINDAGGLFNIEHFDPDSQASIFFWSTLDIRGTQPPPPTGLAEPATLGMMSFGLLTVIGLRRRRTQ